MSDPSEPIAKRVCANLWLLFCWLGRSCLRAWNLYCECLRANLLVRRWMRRKAAQPQSTTNEPFAARVPALLSGKTSSSPAGVSLAVASTVTTFVLVGYCIHGLMSEFGTQVQGQVIATGANETATEALLDGSVVSLRERSTLTVDETGPQCLARLEAGEIIFNARATLERPFTVDTRMLTATVVADATFRVAANSWIEVEVYEGAVKLALKGAKADAPVRWLRKGESFSVPVDAMRPAFAERRDGTNASDGG